MYVLENKETLNTKETLHISQETKSSTVNDTFYLKHYIVLQVLRHSKFILFPVQREESKSSR